MAKRTQLSKNRADSEYAVGYAKPPRATQFQKGVSGNPNGRPKGRRNLASTLYAVLNELVTVHENGRRVRITKFEAACKQLVNKAAAGDGPAVRLLLQLFPTLDALLSDASPAPIDREADQLLVQGLVTRLRAYTPEETTTQENLS